jgi:predicted SnoaL-like aldol condensation-catalyzing enzyme
MEVMDLKAPAIAFLQHAAAGHARTEGAKFVAPGFFHHNAYFAGDGASLLAGMDDNAAQFPDKRLDVKFALQDNDHVTTLCEVQHTHDGPRYAVVHVFRFEGGKIAEMWDVGQEIPADSPNRNGPF